MTTQTVSKRLSAVKGDVVSTPVYTQLHSRSLLEFKFRRYGLTYNVKMYSTLDKNNLAFRQYLALKEGSEVVLYNATYREVPFSFINREGKQQTGTSYQIVVNGK